MRSGESVKIRVCRLEGERKRESEGVKEGLCACLQTQARGCVLSVLVRVSQKLFVSLRVPKVGFYCFLH